MCEPPKRDSYWSNSGGVDFFVGGGGGGCGREVGSMTRKEERRKNSRNGGGPPGKPGCKLVSYCPECGAKDPKFPTTAPHVVVTGLRLGWGTCKAGHRWKVV